MLLLDDPLGRFGGLPFDEPPAVSPSMATLFRELSCGAQLRSLLINASPPLLFGGLPFDESPAAPPLMATLFEELLSLDSSRLLPSRLLPLFGALLFVLSLDSSPPPALRRAAT